MSNPFKVILSFKKYYVINISFKANIMFKTIHGEPPGINYLYLYTMIAYMYQIPFV